MKKSIDNNFKILSETNKFILGHNFEDAYLIDKETNYRFELGNMYGDPSCGLIDKDNKWCIVGGSTLIIRTQDETTEIKADELYWACKIRQTNKNSVQILVDPWADNSSIWEINILDKSYFKVCDFNHYKGKEYTEQIEW
ncbi:MAG: hypothetical protein KF862_14690 [Chitinophagaceae bacterium]|nr:hypothetical protein [Chitinophagaceae bacterium]